MHCSTLPNKNSCLIVQPNLRRFIRENGRQLKGGSKIK